MVTASSTRSVGRRLPREILRFRVVVESDENRWHARVPELESKGTATWGTRREEAFRNIHEVTRMVIEDTLEDGEAILQGVLVYDEPLVSVTV